jgi:hypothetical protein
MNSTSSTSTNACPPGAITRRIVARAPETSRRWSIV